MHYLHRALDLEANDIVEVTLDHPANVQLLSPADFEHYRRGEPFHYSGGYATYSPFRLDIPHAGRWHLVIDLGGGPGIVRASVSVLSNRATS
jgi:hypothetical protein